MNNKTDNSKEFDLFVIGGGSGGVRSARWAAAKGVKVAICEEDRYGGTCVLRGCIPKKMMVYGSHFKADIETAKDYGWDITVNSHDWEFFRKQREKELSRLSGLYSGMLEKNKVTVIKGRGTLVDKNTVEVNGVHYKAKNIIIAVGGRPWSPEILGKENTIDSNGFFDLTKRPQKVVINGGGFIGVEFACLLNHFGSEVHVVIRKKTILTGFDADSSQYLQDQMIKSGIHFHLEEEIQEVINGNQKQITLKSGKSLQADEVILATGRKPYVSGLGLENAEIKTDKNGAIQVDEYSKTSTPNIYAVGDVTDRMNLTPIALQEGMLVVENLFNGKDLPMTYDYVPSAVFSQPPLATVGLTEEIVKMNKTDYEVFTSEFRPLKYTLGDKQVRTFMKMIVEKESNKVLGLHMVGDDAPEIIQGFAVALKAGATKEVFDGTIGLHPSSAEEFVTMRTPRN
ncbi:MAG: glutathione-disulfide reductase [Halobacteriovoraceae bacterium]|nr:glutathione-disulfide reductase [Halobacteriovoraceae bacterium]